MDHKYVNSSQWNACLVSIIKRTNKGTKTKKKHISKPNKQVHQQTRRSNTLKFRAMSRSCLKNEHTTDCFLFPRPSSLSSSTLCRRHHHRSITLHCIALYRATTQIKRFIKIYARHLKATRSGTQRTGFWYKYVLCTPNTTQMQSIHPVCCTTDRDAKLVKRRIFHT